MSLATNLRTKLNVSLEWLYRNIDSVSSREVRDSNSISLVDVLENGTVIDTADKVWTSRATVNDAATTSLDLAGGVTDAFGNALTFVKVKAIAIMNRNTTAGHNLVVGGNANAFASWLGAANDKVTVGPGGFLLLWNPSLAGYAVTAATGDILDLTGSGGNIVYDIAIVGTSA